MTDSAADAATWIFHLAQVLAAMLIFGGALFSLYGGHASWTDRRVPLLIGSAFLFCIVLAAAVSTVASLTGVADSIFSTADISEFLFESSFGAPWRARLAFSLCLTAFSAGFAIFGADGASRSWMKPIGVASLSGGILITFAMAGHAGAAKTLSQSAMAIGWESFHLLAASAWIGSLPDLLTTLTTKVRADGNSAEVAVAVLRRFSHLAMPGVIALGLAGFLTVSTLMETWKLDIHTLAFRNYGAIFAIKLGLIAAMVAIAALNRFWLLPHFSRSPLTVKRRIRVLITIECMLAVAVVAAGVTLSQSSPYE